MTLIATYLMRHTFHDPKSTVGLVFAAMGASSAVAGYYATRMKMPKKRVRFMWLMWISALLSVIIIAFAMNVWPLLVAGVIGAPFLVLGNAVWESLMQSEVPTDFMGRASSVDWFLSLGLAPIGLLLAGAFVEHFGARSYLEWAVLIGLVPSLWALTSRPANAVDHDR
jgi:MFS family permease